MTKIKFSSTQIILGSFLMTVLIGTVLLFLPISSNSGKPTDFLTCLFTATSSLCVTGLVVVDTATHWSLFGQIVILVLIQICGLGVVVVVTIVSMFLGQKISFSQRTVIQEALALQHVGGTIKLIRFILRFVLYYELIGAFLLFFHFINDFNFLTSIWYSIFHSISAFCNAGFDLMGVKGPFSSFTSYESSILLNVTIMLLIIYGGIGFAVWEDLIKMKFDFRKYKLQSKLVIVTTFLLIIIPATYFYFFEYQMNSGVSRILPSLFQSVTTRTAGFNTTNFADMSEVGKAVSIILMLIGGSPGSTAGGMKTTTFAIVMISTMSVFKRYNEPHIFNRRIGIQIIKNAMTIFVMYINLFLLFGFIICKIDGLALTDTLFETASAIGTVGLTLGITTKLSTISRILIIILMFLGRVGGLTFIYSIIPTLNRESGYISENVAVG
ncbi:MAG: Trk family potassium uptake protein [Lachnospiraceae bacterium]|nr:Trk family potassium uptake protein [Lachnospiraceae bacterium]